MELGQIGQNLVNAHCLAALEREPEQELAPIHLQIMEVETALQQMKRMKLKRATLNPAQVIDFT